MNLTSDQSIIKMSRPSSEQKIIVKERAKRCCEYCLSQEGYSPVTFSIEHIVPVVEGGQTKLDNLANSRQLCNNKKYIHTSAIDPVLGQIAPLYNPRQDNWSVHFKWNANATLIIGITSTGRATVMKLDLNREGVVNLREVLSLLGKHPPK